MSTSTFLYKSPRDECGDGTDYAVQYDHGSYWQKFPVLFSIDVVGEYTFAENTPIEVFNAVMNCFLYVNELVGFEFFRYTTDDSKAKIKFAFGPLSGTTTGWCSYSFNRSRKEITRASIILDSTSRKWFVNPKVQCNDSGSYYDIPDVNQHEIGHALGLAHNTQDSKATMKSGGGKGRNLRRTYSKGERALIKKIYTKWVKDTTTGPPEPPSPAPAPTPTPTPIPKPPEMGIILHGGWGANKDPRLWQIVPMRDRPHLFKVVDANRVNVATDFSSIITAQQYIDYHKKIADANK